MIGPTAARYGKLQHADDHMLSPHHNLCRVAFPDLRNRVSGLWTNLGCRKWTGHAALNPYFTLGRDPEIPTSVSRQEFFWPQWRLFSQNMKS